MKKISIQGIKGCFHEEAAKAYYQEEIEVVEQLSFDEVVQSVEKGIAHAGIMAIENTVSGTIHANFELIKESTLTIVGEIYLRIEQNLAVNRGVEILDLEQVESHYMAINQCRKFFRQYPQIQLVDAADTASSMRRVAEYNLTRTGAIGSALAAQYYGLEIIGHGIETDKENYTRFLILEKTAAVTEDVNKSSVQIVLSNKVGGLADALQIIKKHDINLSKIESLPIVGEPWHYQFYLDMLYDDIYKYHEMLAALQPQLEQISVLGNYINQNKTIRHETI